VVGRPPLLDRARARNVKGRAPIYSFNGGEISRRMEGRSDLDGIYDRAVAQMLNFVATVEGPALKRSGFRYIEPEDPTAAWVSRFVFNITQAYLFVWLDNGDGAGKVRFYTNGGRIELVPGVPYELPVPYTAAEAKALSIKQSYDRLYIAHPNHPPGMITRTGAETFTYLPIPLENGPFQDVNTVKSATVTWSGDPEVNGAGATIVCTTEIFDDGMIGSPVTFEVVGFSDIPAWQPQVRTDTLNIGDKRRSDGKVYECAAKAGTDGSEYTGTIEPTHTSGLEWDGSQQIIEGTENDVAGVQWKYLYDRFGAGTITAVTDAMTATIAVTRQLPALSTPTYLWQLAAFSNTAGWPQLVDVWAQRLIFWKGVDIAGSVTGKYFDFSPIDKSGIFAPDQAFRRRLDTPDPPMWTHADKNYLLAGTASGELVVGQINQAAGLSGDNIRADRQSSYGSFQVWPVAIGTSIMWVQRGGRKIREAEFDYSQDRFVAANVNVYARHITRSGINWLAFQQEPEEMLWGGRGDGTLICSPAQHRATGQGLCPRRARRRDGLSGVTIPSEDGGRDELWILADLDGDRAMLQLAEWWDEDAGTRQGRRLFRRLGGELRRRSPSRVHLRPRSSRGAPVRILADGAVVEGQTVTGGSITLPKAASKVHIGLGYQARLKLLRRDPRAPTAQGLRKRLIRCARG
jgi:hypothetical protein